VHDTEALALPMGVYYVDLVPAESSTNWVFTFFYPGADSWEGRNFTVERVG